MPGPSRPTSKGKLPIKHAGRRPNTIGLGQRELGELLDRLENPESQAKNPKRDFVRWPFRETSVRVEIFHPGGVTSWITVACRNISRAGMAILHSAYAHTGTKCRVMLPHPQRGEVPMDGWVTRCCHRSGVVHEIGVRFDQHLNVQEFLRPSPFTDWFSMERINAEDLTGSVVCVEDSDIDQKIIRHFLRETKLNLVVASSGAEALATINEATDLVLTDFHLTDMTGAELATKLRENGLEMPLIILTCDTQTATHEVLANARASAFISKPVSQDVLLRAIGEFLIVQKTASVGGARVSPEKTSAALTDGLLQALGQYAKKLEDCVQRNDVPATRTICLQIAGTAGTVGFRDVNQLATKVAETIARSMSIQESVSAVRSLIAMCQRTSERQPAARDAAPKAAA